MSEKHSPFDFINSILAGEKFGDVNGYAPFMVNRGLSYQQDCVQLANEMNLNGHLDNDMQYDFLYNMITSRKKRRFTKWAKVETNPVIELVSEYYQVNTRRAQEIVSLLNKDEIDMIRERLYKGGR